MEEDDEFENYIWLETIGKGNMQNVVHKVKNLNDNKTYALKKMIIDTSDKKQCEKYQNEISIFKSLDHPYIIKYYNSFIKNNYLCIIMEYAAGGDLQHLIKNHKEKQKQIPEKQIWVLFLQLCCAIKYVHYKKILHRDIKTQNVFLDSQGIVSYNLIIRLN